MFPVSSSVEEGSCAYWNYENGMAIAVVENEIIEMRMRSRRIVKYNNHKPFSALCLSVRNYFEQNSLSCTLPVFD